MGRVLPTLGSEDCLVFLGDYIDKGPDTRGCIEYLAALRRNPPCRIVTLLRNHELSMLQTWRDPTSHSWIWIGGLETIASYSVDAAAEIRAELEAAGLRLVTEKIRINCEVFFDLLPPAHQDFFMGLTPYFETDELICVHAGVEPQGPPLDSQDTGVLTAMRFPDLTVSQSLSRHVVA